MESIAKLVEGVKNNVGRLYRQSTGEKISASQN